MIYFLSAPRPAAVDGASALCRAAAKVGLPQAQHSRIQALVVYPKEAHTVVAGGDTGLFASHDGGARWERIGSNGALPTNWSLTIDPVEPDILFAGTRPAGVYRSRDGGL